MPTTNVYEEMMYYMGCLWRCGKRSIKELSKDEYITLSGHIILNNISYFINLLEKKSTWGYTNLLQYIATAMAATDDVKEKYDKNLRNAWEEIVCHVSVSNLEPIMEKLFTKAGFEFMDHREHQAWKEDVNEANREAFEKRMHGGYV